MKTSSCATSSSPSLVTSQSQNRLQTVKYLSQLLPLTFSPCTPLPGSFILLQTHRHFESLILNLKPLANTLSLLCSSAMEFSPFWLLSHSILPCLKNCIKQLISTITNTTLLSSSFCTPSPWLYSVCICVSDVRKEDNIMFICFYVYIFADLLKCSVFTLVSEIPSIETTAIIIINVFNHDTQQNMWTCASGVTVLSSIHQMYWKGFWSLQIFSVNKQQAPNAVNASRSCSTGDPLAAGSLWCVQPHFLQGWSKIEIGCTWKNRIVCDHKVRIFTACWLQGYLGYIISAAIPGV